MPWGDAVSSFSMGAVQPASLGAKRGVTSNKNLLCGIMVNDCMEAGALQGETRLNTNMNF